MIFRETRLPKLNHAEASDTNAFLCIAVHIFTAIADIEPKPLLYLG